MVYRSYRFSVIALWLVLLGLPLQSRLKFHHSFLHSHTSESYNFGSPYSYQLSDLPIRLVYVYFNIIVAIYVAVDILDLVLIQSQHQCYQYSVSSILANFYITQDTVSKRFFLIPQSIKEASACANSMYYKYMVWGRLKIAQSNNSTEIKATLLILLRVVMVPGQISCQDLTRLVYPIRPSAHTISYIQILGAFALLLIDIIPIIPGINISPIQP